MSLRTLRLGEIALEDRTIVAPDSSEAASRPYLGLEQIESGTGRILSYDGSSAEGKSTTFAFDESHVLYGKLRPYLNKVVAPERKGRCSTEIIPLLPQGVDREFLAFFLRTDNVVNAAMSDKTGSRMPRADMDALLDIEVSIPETLSEQRQIAARLKAQLAEVDTARQAARAQVRDAALLRQRLLQAAFSSLDDTPRKALREIADIQLGKMLSPKAKTGTAAFPYLRNQNVQWGRFVLRDLATMDFDERERKKFSLRRGDLLLCEGGEPGRCAVWEEQVLDCYYQKALHRIRPHEGIADSVFLSHWIRLQAQTGTFKDQNAKTTIAHLPQVRLEQLQVPALPIPTQRRIVARLQSQLAETDAIANAASVQLAEIERLPQRILAHAFATPA